MPAADDPSPTQDIDELIERTNHLESFRATYLMHSSDGEETRVYWTYLADGQARVRMEQDDQLSDVVWFDDGVMTVAVKDKPGKQRMVGADVGAMILEYSSMQDALDRHFPMTDPVPYEPQLEFQLNLDAESNRTDFSISLSDRRRAMCNWLALRRGDEPIEQDDPLLLVFDDGTARYEISATSGFIEKGFIGAGDERRLAMELLELELDVDLPAKEFDAPKWTFQSEQEELGFRGMVSAQLMDSTRTTLYRRLRILDEDGELDWDDEGPDGLAEVLHELFVAAIVAPNEAYFGELETQLEEMAEQVGIWADEHREEPGFAEALTASIRANRADLQAHVEGMIESRVEGLRLPRGVHVAPEFAEELLDLEREALRSAMQEDLLRVALERHDETVGSVE